MNKVQIPKLIKWVTSGSMNPLALFQRAFPEVTAPDRVTVESLYKLFRPHYKTQDHFDNHVNRIYLAILFYQEAIKKALNTPVKGFHFPETEQYSALYADGWIPARSHRVPNTIETLTKFRKDDYRTTGHQFIITDGEDNDPKSFAEIGQRFLDNLGNHGLKIETCPTFNKILEDVPVDPSETNTD